jgi:predicted helicase
MELNLKPSHKAVKAYYDVLGQYGQLNIDHEMAVRSAFQGLLRTCGNQFDWTLVPEYPIQRPPRIIKVDGALLDTFKLTHGFWEAKDEHDDLEKEIRAKFERGYPRSNIIFQAPERAILFQNGVRQGLDEDLRDPKNLVELLKHFFEWREPHHEEWDSAVAEFKEHIPQLAAAVKEKIEAQRRSNPEFVRRFDAFYALCRQAINPNLTVEAVEKMLIQHLLTERIFRKIFDNPDFTRRNVIAVEIEKIIDAMTEKAFSRDAFLKDLDRFYRAIEDSAEATEDYAQKQAFMNSVYERFFQGYSPKEADTHGIVYTPQPIVDFMVRSVEDILKKEFGKSLSDKGVHILDPFVGTGNFITRIMREIKKTSLQYKYEHELHCNEVMLLPYYVASMNIEHAYMEATGEYKPFPGICLVDTFELAEPKQAALFSEENTARVQHQKESPIFVVIGNPPYNANQQNENDNNRNRTYPVLQRRIADTYGKHSSAVNKNTLADPYVKAFRWASDRIGDEGIVAFVSNNSFLEALAFDGMRRNLERDFSIVYHLDLKGNARTTGEQRRREGGNIFDDQIRVGVGITFLIKTKRTVRNTAILINRVGDSLTSAAKSSFLESVGEVSGVNWLKILSDEKNRWLVRGSATDFDDLLALSAIGDHAIFEFYSNGYQTNRDAWVYNFQKCELSTNVSRFIDAYEDEMLRWNRSERKSVDSFVTPDERRVKWCSKLKQQLENNVHIQLEQSKLVRSRYRPYSIQWLYYEDKLAHRAGKNRRFFPTGTPGQNVAILVTAHSQIGFSTQLLDCVPCLDVGGRPSQSFPFYTYSEDGSNRRENITDWALNEFRSRYNDPSITKWDIFHYVYAVLHHPTYRGRYAANLKRELPRIPFIGSHGIMTAKNMDAPPLSAGQGGRVPEARTEGSPARSAGFRAHHEITSPGGTADNSDASDAPASQLPNYEITNLPNASIFHAFARAGARLAELHVNYEQQPEYPLERLENPNEKLNWRVEKMKLSKDKTTLFYNSFLTLKGIPLETSEYRLGNRSALEWVIDQYQVSTDKRSGITNDPNRPDDPQYILRLIGQVITVSLETMKIVKALPPLGVEQAATAGT